MFRIFGIPVTVRPMFLFVTLFLGASSSTDPINIGIWFVVVFISILIHELGHALTGRAMGLEPQILLHGFGGLAIFSNPRDVDVSIPRSVAITLAGPFAGFAFGALVYLAVYAGLARLDTPYLVTAISYLLWVNIGWGLVNLLPIMPLDGGQVVAAVLRRVPRGQLISYVVSAAIALAATGVAAYFRYWFAAVMAVWLLFDNLRDLQTLYHEAADAPLWRSLQRLWRQRTKRPSDELSRELESIAAAAKGPALQAQVRVRLAELAVDRGDGELASGHLAKIPREMQDDPEIQLQMMIVLGRGEEAYQTAKQQYDQAPEEHRLYFLQMLTALERYAELSIELAKLRDADDDALSIARAAVLRALASGFAADALEIAQWLVGRSKTARDAVILGTALWRHERRDEALTCFERAAREQPRLFPDWIAEIDGLDEVRQHPRVKAALAKGGSR